MIHASHKRERTEALRLAKEGGGGAAMTLQLPPELMAWREGLTTLASEDWQIILDGKTAHVMALQEDPTPMGRKIVSFALFEIPIIKMKKVVKAPPVGRPLGCVTVIVCGDNGWASRNLLDWLVRVARRRGFSVLLVAGPASTAEAIELQRGYMDSGWVEALGFTKIDAMAAGHA